MGVLASFVSMPSETTISLRILLALLLGGIIGLEREVEGHPAGLRTHISVALGAVLFGVISAYGFNHFQSLRNDNNYQIDVTRVASQVVVGVGFLGGGAILRSGAETRASTMDAGPASQWDVPSGPSTASSVNRFSTGSLNTSAASAGGAVTAASLAGELDSRTLCASAAGVPSRTAQPAAASTTAIRARKGNREAMFSHLLGNSSFRER